MNSKYKKLELCWPGKDIEVKPEPRVLIEDPEKSYGEIDTENMLIHAVEGRQNNLLFRWCFSKWNGQ